jgi:hypothetical protein
MILKFWKIRNPISRGTLKSALKKAALSFLFFQGGLLVGYFLFKTELSIAPESPVRYEKVVDPFIRTFRDPSSLQPHVREELEKESKIVSRKFEEI